MLNEKIKIVEGGERLYVHPFSVARCSTAAVHYLTDNECEAYQNDYLIKLERYPPGYKLHNLFKRIWYFVGLRVLVGTKRWLAFQWNYTKRFWKWEIGSLEQFILLAEPFIATDYPELRLHVRYQLAVNDPDRISDVYYLNPSQHWIRNQINIGLISNNLGHDQEDFVNWRKHQLELGRDIQYIVSLDT